MKKLFGENDIEAVLQRLDRLTQDEARATATLSMGWAWPAWPEGQPGPDPQGLGLGQTLGGPGPVWWGHRPGLVDPDLRGWIRARPDQPQQNSQASRNTE